MASKKLIATLKEKAAAVQVIVQEVPNLEAAFTYALAVTQAQGGATLAAPGWDAESRAALEADCRRNGVELLVENLRERADALHTGLTRADWGIADTGSLVLDSASEDLRLATMLVETHVAVLPVSRLRATVTDLEEEMTRLMAGPAWLPGLYHRGLPHRRHRAGPDPRGARPPGTPSAAAEGLMP